jgi:dUTP pyrophosphatase
MKGTINRIKWMLTGKVDVKIKRLSDGAVIPVYARPGDAGFDLVATEDVIVEPGMTVIVPTGIAVAVPEGFELQVRPRSGVSAKTFLRVSNAPGTVDSGYRGEVGVLIDNTAPDTYNPFQGALNQVRAEWVINLKQEKEPAPEGRAVRPLSYIIKKGDRIAQGVIAPVFQATFEEVIELDDTERGSGGFGSTGVKRS